MQEESTEVRKLLLDIIARMAVIGYSFHANVNIKVIIESLIPVNKIPLVPYVLDIQKFCLVNKSH